jgi:hypothetical protein
MTHFDLDADEQAKLDAWQISHKCKKKLVKGDSRSLTYKFSSESGIGLSIMVECNACHKVIDLTDVSKW